MKGPINFVFTVLWLAIGLAIFGTLKECTLTMIGYAIQSQHEQMSLRAWNSKLVPKEN